MNPPTEVVDFVDDLRDGLVLISLIEVLLGISVTRAEPSSKRINQIRNVQEVMRILVQHNVRVYIVSSLSRFKFRLLTSFR